MNTPQLFADRLELARTLAVEAGKGTLAHFQTDDLIVDRKSDDSPVTVADREAEELIRARVLERFPDDSVLGEEYGETNGSSPFRWIVDPVDGTKAFVSGVPLYGTMIGVEYEGKAAIGAIYIPGLDELVYAATGHGAWHVRQGAAPKPAKVNNGAPLEEGLFVTSQASKFAARGAKEAYDRLESTAWLTRTWADAYGYVLVATGRAVVMVDPIMSVWDASAAQPILEEAGGIFTDWNGDPTARHHEGVGCSQRVHEEVLEILRQFPRTA
ncbi:histidinol-phosphatase [Blastopirellula marina]|uniref:Histidinol-phosphatase n=1 Tax=Blastopirellula marina DSM 3645 TaxID=314230 RepID=A3ZUL3_9BACT|nr:histidinol-phosphatase [Blastopirellula marina]EAQ79928.1 inositol monophosphatase family protein [Blastopirellula marina DSM 3645]